MKVYGSDQACCCGGNLKIMIAMELVYQSGVNIFACIVGVSVF